MFSKHLAITFVIVLIGFFYFISLKGIENDSTGQTLIGVFFIVYLIYAVTRSKK